jgi:lactoylglutathione lyase
MLHITIMSKDVDTSVDFYQNVVGLELVRDNRGTEHPIAFLQDADRTVSIEVAGNPDSAFTGSGLAVGFEVDDVEALHAELEGQGYAPGPVLSPDPHAQFFFMDDPNGVNLQFVHESA